MENEEANRKRLICFFVAKITILMSVLLYAYSLHYAHAFYLSEEQWVWGFNEVSIGATKLVLMLVLIAVPTYVLPLKIDRSSSLFIYLLFAMVYIPAIVIGTGNRHDSIDVYGAAFVAFCAGFLFICLSVEVVNSAHRHFSTSSALAETAPTSLAFYVFLVLWVVLCAALYLNYYDKMSFAGLDSVYEQRERGLASSRLMGYIQVYFAYVLSPILMVMGLHRRRLFIVLLALFGFISMYLITAERTVFLLPFVVLGLYFVVKANLTGFKSIILFFLCSASGIFLITEFYQDSEVVYGLGFYYLTRLMGYPGLFITQYYELFSTDGFTYWSHVTGLSALVDVPQAYLYDDKWPMLGKILAERVLNVESNSNASLFATDGVAAFGATGIFIISVFLSVWLALLDAVTRRWKRSLVLPVLFPAAFALTNASLFTVLLSFGGIFWTLYFAIGSRGQSNSQITTG